MEEEAGRQPGAQTSEQPWLNSDNCLRRGELLPLVAEKAPPSFSKKSILHKSSKENWGIQEPF